MGTSKEQFISLSQTCPGRLGRGASLPTHSKRRPGWLSSSQTVEVNEDINLNFFKRTHWIFLQSRTSDFDKLPFSDQNTRISFLSAYETFVWILIHVRELLIFNMIHLQLTVLIPSIAMYSSPSVHENWTFPQSEGYCQVPYLVFLWWVWQRKGFNFTLKNYQLQPHCNLPLQSQPNPNICLVKE